MNGFRGRCQFPRLNNKIGVAKAIARTVGANTFQPQGTVDFLLDYVLSVI